MRYLPVAESEDGLGLIDGQAISFGGDGYAPGSFWQQAARGSGGCPATTWIGVGLIAVGLWLVLGGRRG